MVNLAGALKSIQQSVTGRKIPFARTPKVRNRTAAPALYVVSTYLAGPYLLLISWVAAQMNRWPVSVMATTTAVVAIIAAMAFVPPRPLGRTCGRSAPVADPDRDGPRRQIVCSVRSGSLVASSSASACSS